MVLLPYGPKRTSGQVPVTARIAAPGSLVVSRTSSSTPVHGGGKFAAYLAHSVSPVAAARQNRASGPLKGVTSAARSFVMRYLPYVISNPSLIQASIPPTTLNNCVKPCRWRMEQARLLRCPLAQVTASGCVLSISWRRCSTKEYGMCIAPLICPSPHSSWSRTSRIRRSCCSAGQGQKGGRGLLVLAAVAFSEVDHVGGALRQILVHIVDELATGALCQRGIVFAFKADGRTGLGIHAATA